MAVDRLPVQPFLQYVGDCALVRDLYADCSIEEVRRVRTINQSSRREYVELIITP